MQRIFGDMRSAGICGASNRGPENPKQERGCAQHILSVFRQDSNAGRSPYRVDRGQKHCPSASICSSICSSRRLIRGINMQSNSSWKTFYFKPLRLSTLHIHRLYISPNMQCSAYLGGWAETPNFTSVEDLRERILAFIAYFNKTMAKPFKWTYKGRPLTV